MAKRSNTFSVAIFVWITVIMVNGCSGGKVPEPVYPAPPIDYKLYDMSIIEKESEWHINNAHDPSIIKADGQYYVFSTDVRAGGELRPGIMVRKSKDLIEWEWVGYAFEDGIPKSALAWTDAVNLWAPDVAKMGDTYFLYYSASQFGTNESFIGVATGSSIEGPWSDQGEVVKTTKGDIPNAIDPNVVFDAQGDPWMAYGSFFGGIYIARLDPSTGKFKEDGFGKQIASRDHRTEQGALEGPYIIYKPDLNKYYLFVSYDSLFADYNVRVGRSDSVTGPYLDFNGRDLNDSSYEPQYEVGNKILGGYRFSEGEGWVAPGHNSVLQDGDRDLFVHHARGQSRTSWSYLHVRKMVWTDDGWPVISPERYAGETVQSIPLTAISGEWERIVHYPDKNGRVDAEPFHIFPDGKVIQDRVNGEWKFDRKHTITIKWHDEHGKLKSEENLQILPSWDWELKRPALTFTGMNNDGIAIWGKRIGD